MAVVVVTHNRAKLLPGLLDGLLAQTRAPDAVIVVNNASTDDTPGVLAAYADRLPLQVVTQENLGGAGGFARGVAEAHAAGFDRLWLMDDDVVPAPDCLEVLMAEDEDCLIPVREDPDGKIVEKAALRFDLDNPLAIKPKTSTFDEVHRVREEMPRRVPVENVAFEGFMMRRAVVDRIGLPDAAFFIFYDDCDYAIRARAAGWTIWALRDARLIRQIPFDQQQALDGWKGYYMYRNLFTVHFRHGRNRLVRAKPYAIAAAVTALSPVRGGRGEARNVLTALRDARSVRRGAVVRGPRG